MANQNPQPQKPAVPPVNQPHQQTPAPQANQPHQNDPQHTQTKEVQEPQKPDLKKQQDDLAKEQAANEMMRQKMHQRPMPHSQPVPGAEHKPVAISGLVPLAQISLQYAEHIDAFNSPGTGAAINFLLSMGYKLGPIIAVILANLPAIMAAIKTGDPSAIITLLLGLLGKPTAAAVPSARIGT